ncbi:DnaT-like ssDNA-binding protein [Synechococcus sp. M16CYN]|uniref:DnaT-like ssDNA-binding protein n=1 Tax=Synechococcus sp. M16CYN TaxID=3103139 RepID=UPI0032537C22
MTNLDSSLSKESSNSYVDQVFADEYAANQPWADKWAALTDDQKAMSLIRATSWMETLNYSGSRCTTTQRLSWPRTNASCDGVPATCDVIPYSIRRAEVELAWQAHQNPNAIMSSDDSASVGTYAKHQDSDSSIVEHDQCQGISVTDCKDLSVITAFPWIKWLIGSWIGNEINDNVSFVLRLRS